MVTEPVRRGKTLHKTKKQITTAYLPTHLRERSLRKPELWQAQQPRRPTASAGSPEAQLLEADKPRDNPILNRKSNHFSLEKQHTSLRMRGSTRPVWTQSPRPDSLAGYVYTHTVDDQSTTAPPQDARTSFARSFIWRSRDSTPCGRSISAPARSPWYRWDDNIRCPSLRSTPRSLQPCRWLRDQITTRSNAFRQTSGRPTRNMYTSMMSLARCGTASPRCGRKSWH